MIDVSLVFTTSRSGVNAGANGVPKKSLSEKSCLKWITSEYAHLICFAFCNWKISSNSPSASLVNSTDSGATGNIEIGFPVLSLLMIAKALLLIQSCATIFSRNICSVISAFGSSKSIFRDLLLSNSATTFPFSSTVSFICLMIALPTAFTFGLIHALTMSELYVVPCQEKKVLHCSELNPWICAVVFLALSEQIKNTHFAYSPFFQDFC